MVAGALGAAGILPYVIAAFGMGLIALCFVESGSRMPAAGGTYADVETALGQFIEPQRDFTFARAYDPGTCAREP